MSKPYIVCHMMTVLDGRIDCGMTAKMPGVEEYYSTLAALNAPTSWSGRVTAQLEMAEPGQFRAENPEAVGKECVLKQASAEGYTVVADTKGTLLWPDDTGSRAPLVVVTSEQVSNEYLAYLSRRHISWIVCGKTHIDLARACEILNREFGVERMAIVGGGRINAGFLDAGLLDEVSILLAPGIDGRGGMAAAFDGLPMDREPYRLKLTGVTPYENGAVWLRYAVK
ncbi:MAG: dihydrofolate reductase family protein [Oscillospiraceae bacterium]|nr:dihydrofolate reductase family protein [Oscillospiraceae bacterium]